MRKNYKKYIMFNSEFLDLPEIVETMDKYKAVGLSAVLLMLERLLHRTHAIGRIEQSGYLHKKLGIQKRTLYKLIHEMPVFRVDDNGLFWSPRLRQKLGLPADPTEEEIADVLKNGNIYYGSQQTESAADTLSTKEIKTFSKHSSKSTPQLSDNQQKHISNKDKDISDSNKEIESNKEKTKNISTCAADYDAKEFREILSSRSWCRSVKKRMSVDLEDDKILASFAEWMANYCATMEKKLKNKTDLRQYACNLLRPGSKTRAEFDNSMTESTKEPKETVEIAVQAKSKYEEVMDGIRYSCNGQLLPDASTGQPEPQAMYSYINNCWIDKSAYDKDREITTLKNNIRSNPRYIARLGGAVC